MQQQNKLKRSIINAQLIDSTLPITLALAKAPFTKGIKGMDFFSTKTLYEFTLRINRITSNSEKQWGTMTPDQMLHHLNLATGSALGYYDLPDKSYLLSRTVFKWILVDE